MILNPPVRLATRGSALALWQARRVADLIRQVSPLQSVELIELTTKPDRHPETSLEKMGGDKGLFVKELEQALLDGRADAAVHSLKDVPVEMADDRLRLVAFPERANPSDVLLVRDASVSGAPSPLLALPTAARVATSALRRRAQLLRKRPDLELVDVRGNVDTRLRKLVSGEFDAIILAAAGLQRLDLLGQAATKFPTEDFLPAPGQGVLAIQASANSPHANLWAALDNNDVRLQAEAEREFSRCIGATCRSAAGCYLQIDGSSANFQAAVFSADGQQVCQTSSAGSREEALSLARAAADQLIKAGCKTLL